MICRLAYVACDRCGEPIADKQMAEDVFGAYVQARRLGMVRVRDTTGRLLHVCAPCKTTSPEGAQQ